MTAHPSTNGLARVLEECIDFIRSRGLEVKGIFRTSPNVQHLRTAKEMYERDEQVDLGDFGPAVAAGLIKGHLRDMAEPVFPSKVLREIPSEPDSHYVKDKVVSSLNPSQKAILVALTSLLRDVHRHSEINGMDASNLATLIVPNMIRIEDPLQEMKMASVSRRQSDPPKVGTGTVGDVLVVCIEQHDHVFG